MLRIVLAALASMVMIAGAEAEDGARAYFLVPENTNTASLSANYLHGGVGAGRLDIGVLTASYRRTLDFGGQAGAILIGLPVGTLSGSIDVGGGVVMPQNNPLALGDLFVGGELGLIGSPSLSPLDYAQYKPGFRAGVAAKLFLPTGDYSSARLANLGQNRWSLQASLPISYVLAGSMVDPSITTFELIPSVHIFGDNPDAYGAASVASQEPIWKLEGHLTHTLSPVVWAAVDAYLSRGGKLSYDGVQVAAAQDTVALGATLGLVLSQSLALRLTYIEQVYSSTATAVGRGVELTAAYTF